MGVSNKSETRAMFISSASFGAQPDWNLIAQTLKDCKIDALYGEWADANWAHYPSAYARTVYFDTLQPAIAACHAQTPPIEVHFLFCMLLGYGPPETRVVRSGGGRAGFTCPTNPATRRYLKNRVEEVTTNYDIDGFMFDYIRYDDTDMCYCNHCKAAFETWLGEGPITNWSPFYPGGARHGEYLEWRVIPITELVRDIRTWMLTIKPELEFGAAVFGPLPGSPSYWRLEIGQDWVDWVDKGYLDTVSPMCYWDSYTPTFAQQVDALLDILGGPEGKIPLAIFLATAYPGVANLAWYIREVQEIMRPKGGDGWNNYAYGGPGDPSSGYPDIRNYYTALAMPDVFTLKDIVCTPSATSAIITWTTDLPATSKVEYSTSPLFTTSLVYDPSQGFHYRDIDHVPGTVVEDAAPVTVHSIPLTGLLPGTLYYFRVQSEGSGGIATSKVGTFRTPPALPGWTITISSSPADAGTTDPYGTVDVPAGQDLTVTATPNLGYLFDHWESRVPEVNMTTVNPVTVPAQTEGTTHTLLAFFTALPTHTLTITATAGGVTDPPVGSHIYQEGVSVTVTAYPDSGYLFDHWELNGVVHTENPIVIIIDADYTLHGIFGEIPEQATIQGTVTDPTGNPIEGAIISINAYSTITETDGSYSLIIPVGVYTLTVTKEGYEIYSEPLDAPAPGTYTVDVTLTPTPPPPCPATVIASAIYGPSLELDVLRNFRDGFMSRNRFGKFLAHNYYRIGKHVAKGLENKRLTKQILKGLLDLIIKVVRRRQSELRTV